VLRPLTKNLLAALHRERTVGPTVLAAAPAGGSLGAPVASAVVLIDPAQQLTQARTLVHQDPKRVAQVVRGWVEQDG
jgi:flagellar biosynthesis/type III secretory pathway M-ring protein FliF/YscJ